MIKHNLLLLLRNFWRFKTTFFINLAGLSAGLACTLLIYYWVTDEIQMDQFHEKKDRLFEVMENRVKSGGIWTAYTTSGLLGETITSDMPEVEMAFNMSMDQGATFTVGDKNLKVRGNFAGKDFFKMFSFPLLQGNADKVLLEKNAVVISDDLALRLFNTVDNVVGRTIEYDHHDMYVVSGVFRKMPKTSSMQMDFVATFEKFKEGKEWLLSWGNSGTVAYVLLKPDADVDAFNAKFANYIKIKTNGESAYRTPFLKLFSRVYLYDGYDNGVESGGRIWYVKLFSIIAVFILFIACINFMNLSTARASRRMKEVGIKKVVGAGRRVLIVQYLGESVLMAVLSLLLAILIADLLLPQFNLITGKNIAIHFDGFTILQLVAITTFTGLVAGSYPALYLSGLNPAVVLKGKFTSAIGEQWARKGLVIFQFTISIIFIVSVIVVYRQIDYLQSKNLGYDQAQVVSIGREGALWDEGKLETFVSELKAVPGVLNAASIGHNLMGHNSGTYGVEWPGKDPKDRSEFENVSVNYGTMETLGIELKEGRGFTQNPSDTAKIIFNEAAIQFMGLEDPVGTVVKLWGDNREIIGVVKDFNFQSLHQKVKPVFLQLAPGNTWNIMVKLAPGPQHEAIERIEKLYHQVNPGFIFQYSFLEEDHHKLYDSERRVATLSRYFAVLAVFISCLGLFGLVSFTAERRLKEIGIRKVLGSSVLRIVFLLSGDFTKTVLISILLALPLSYFFANYWLKDFAYRAPLAWWYFVLAGLLALAISWLTISTQAFKAARVNPVKCLKEQ